MLNKVTLIGNIGSDPEIRFMPNGDAVANFSLATSRRWKDKQTGERKEETEWHRVTVFAPLSGIVEKYLHKGSKIYIEGRIKTRKYQKDGQDHYSTEIIGEQLIMLDGKTDDNSGQSGQQQGQRPQQTQQQRPQQQQRQPAQSNQPAPYDDFDSDIPFN